MNWLERYLSPHQPLIPYMVKNVLIIGVPFSLLVGAATYLLLLILLKG
jgi:hypothetical protein